MTNSRKISIISLIVIVALAFALIFTLAVAPVAKADSSIAYMAWDEDSQTVKEVEGGCAEYNVVTTGTMGLVSEWYVLKENVTISSSIAVSGTVNLILCDGATLTAEKGIVVSSGNTLNVYAQSTGEDMGAIVAIGDDGAAGIGGGYAGGGGNVNIHGGVITATGDDGAAGIGGGDIGNGGNVNIYGGIITATGGEYAGGSNGGAGIGGGVGIGGGDAGGNGALTVAEGYVVYGGDSADPTTVIEKSDNDYARHQYMIVTVPEPVSGGDTLNLDDLQVGDIISGAYSVVTGNTITAINLVPNRYAAMDPNNVANGTMKMYIEAYPSSFINKDGTICFHISDMGADFYPIAENGEQGTGWVVVAIENGEVCFGGYQVGQSSEQSSAQYKNTTTVIKFDDKDWYLIDYDDSTVTLLSKECVGASQFGSENTYAGSTVETAVNNYYAESISTGAKTAVSNNNMFLLSTDEAKIIYNANPDVLKCSMASGAEDNVWWLCSQGYDYYYAAGVYGVDGEVDEDGYNLSYEYGVRPALKLDLSKVEFDSETKTFAVPTPTHTHDYSTDWSSDASTHWHACTAEGECDAPKADEAAHTYAETMTDATYYTCSVCSYVDNDRKAAYDSAMAVAAVIEKIAAIGEVTYTDASKEKIDAARDAYDALTEEQQALVETLDTLTAAESAYATLKEDSEAADPVEALIDAIGEVAYTSESKDKIDAARAAYDALTESQQAFVANVNTLTAAENTYATLKTNTEAADAVEALIDAIGEVTYTTESKDKIDAARTAYDALTAAQKALVGNVNTLTDAETDYTILKALDEDPSAHVHDRVVFTAWESTTSLPGSAGNYYLTGNVTLGGSWSKPGGTVNLCLNGYGITTTSGRVITMNGGTLNLYDCGDTTHYFDVDSNGKAINVNDNSGAKSFKGGYITGGKGQGGLSNTSLYWGEGGGILVWSGTFNMYGGTILGNAAGHGGGVEVVNATMNFYGGNIIYNQAAGNLGYGNKNGEGGAGINLRSQSGNTVTLNMYGGNVCYNRGTAIDQSYRYGNGQFNLYSGNISHNNGTGIWFHNTAIDGDPVIEDNSGNGVLCSVFSIKGTPVIRNNANSNLYVYTDCTITLAGALDIEEPIGVTMRAGTGVFTSGASTLAGDPLSYFYSDSGDYRVVTEGEELKLIEGRTLYINNLQGTIKSVDVEKTETIASVKAEAAELFGVNGAEYKLTYEGDDLNEADTLEAAGIPGRATLAFVPTVGGLKTLTLEPSVETNAAVTPSGVYSSIKQGDTITITYASTQNSGFVEAIFTTAFDEEYFHLTSISVDDYYYTLFDNYGRRVNGSYVPMTLQEWIDDHNASLDAGETPYAGRLTISMQLKDALRDTLGVLSENFITVTYTAVKDVPAGMECAFGLDMSLDGMFTQAAYDDDILLHIIDKDGRSVNEEMVTLLVKAITEVSIDEDQVLTFHRSGSNYSVDPADIELTWIAPTGDPNPYLAETGSSVTYTFYTKVGEDYVRVEDGLGNPIVPNAVGDYFVKATVAETGAYLGYETDYVAISVAKILLDVPDLKLYAGEEGKTATYDADNEILTITQDTVTYGTTLTLKEIVNSAEEVYSLPAVSGAVEDLSYSFQTKDGESWSAADNFFTTQPLPVGTYKLTIAPRNSDYVAFDADPAVNAIVIEFTIVKAKVVAPTETVLTYTYSGEEQTYTFETTGSTTLYTVTNDKRADAGSQTVTVAINDKANYEWEAGGVDDLPFTFVINKKKLTVKTYIAGEVEHALTYGDAVPAESAFTYTVEGILAAEEEAILAALDEIFAIAPEDVGYVQYAGVGEYVYTTTAGGDLPANYEIEVVETAKITVSAKALTIVTDYAGGVATFTLSGVVNNDELAVTYSVNTVALPGNTYTAVIDDLTRELTVSAAIAENDNYTVADETLSAVYSVSFLAGEEFAAATGIPAAQYIFSGCYAVEPSEAPAIANHDFLYWQKDSVRFYFDTTAITANTELTAKWEKMVFTYKFRALNDGADYATGLYRELKWENDAFVLADASAAFAFTKNTAISRNATVGCFRVNRWVKAVKVAGEYVYTVVDKFESEVSVEINEDAYYIAIMALDLGRGDVNGDGAVSAEDIMMMKKYLVGVRYSAVNTSAVAWEKIGQESPETGYIYIFLWDTNADGYKDTRDILTTIEALATGYGYEIRSDVTVNGVYYSNQTIVSTDDQVFLGNVAGDENFVTVNNEEELFAALDAGKKVGCLADITISDDSEHPDQTRLYKLEDGDIYIDFGGHVLTVNKIKFQAEYGSVTIKNGYLAFVNYDSEITLASETGYTIESVLRASDNNPLDSQGEGNTTIAANID